MKFLCLAYGDERKWSALPQSTQTALLAQDDLLRARGDLVAEVLAPTTVRFAGGHAHTSDGSFGQAPLPLAGFYVLEARDMDEAIGLLSKTPCAPAGAYELRPLAWRAPGTWGHLAIATLGKGGGITWLESARI